MGKILVTGGAGFLGSHLCKKLVDTGCDVVCLDNLYTGRLVNIESLVNKDKFQFINFDITKPLTELFLNESISEIYNLACPASPLHYKRDAIFTTKTAVVGTINILELANDKKAKILQASTSEVYGDPLVHPQVENYNGNVSPNNERSCYTEGKRCAESLCFDFYRQHQVDVKVARIFNVYGPNMAPDDGRVISNFIQQALNNSDLTIMGEGTQTRSFCYVDDMISGLMQLMLCKQGEPQPVNLGNPQEISIINLANLILDKIKTQSKIVYQDISAGDPLMRRPNINLAKSSFSWAPEIPLNIGIDKTIEHFSLFR